MFTYWVYFLSSKPYGTIYVGVTNNLPGRVEDYRNGKGSAFTAKYEVKRLVYYEPFADVRVAIQREKSLKHWVQHRKINLIELDNPRWIELYPALRALPGNASDPVRGEVGPRTKSEDDICG